MLPIPLPESFFYLTEFHRFFAIYPTMLATLTAVTLLILWVPGYDELSGELKETAKRRILTGLVMLALGVLSLLFGLYIWVPLTLLAAGDFLVILYKGGAIAFSMIKKPQKGR